MPSLPADYSSLEHNSHGQRPRATNPHSVKPIHAQGFAARPRLPRLRRRVRSGGGTFAAVALWRLPCVVVRLSLPSSAWRFLPCTYYGKKTAKGNATFKKIFRGLFGHKRTAARVGRRRVRSLVNPHRARPFDGYGGLAFSRRRLSCPAVRLLFHRYIRARYSVKCAFAWR